MSWFHVSAYFMVKVIYFSISSILKGIMELWLLVYTLNMCKNLIYITIAIYRAIYVFKSHLGFSSQKQERCHS